MVSLSSRQQEMTYDPVNGSSDMNTKDKNHGKCHQSNVCLEENQVKCGLEESRVMCGLEESRVMCGLEESQVMCGLEESRVMCGLEESRVKFNSTVSYPLREPAL